MSRFDRYTVLRKFRKATDIHTQPAVWILDKETQQALAYIQTLSPMAYFSEDAQYDYRAFLINHYQLNFSELGKSSLFEQRRLSDVIEAVTQIDLIQRLREQSYYRIVLEDQGEQHLLVIDEPGYSVVHGLPRDSKCIFTRDAAERIMSKIKAKPDTVRHRGCNLFTPFDISRLQIEPLNLSIEALLSAHSNLDC